MRHTGVFRIVERRGAEANGCFSKKMLQRAKLLFSSKTVLCNASDVETDGTYKRYFPFGVTSARKQNVVFHGKLTKNLTIFCVKSNQLQRNDGGRRCGILAYSALSNDEARKQMVAFQKKCYKEPNCFFRQKRYYATQAMSRRTGHTRGISRSARRVRGSRMPCFTKKKIRAFRHMQDPPHRPDRGRYRSARSTPRRRRRTRGCTSARRCVEERSRHPVRWL